ncbi:MAG TPA: M48 family metalloprotease [Candidatus Wallbacteria bacterium]|nr:M48 family metalloprotease [Candidatus Wallbacteria bacterium]
MNDFFNRLIYITFSFYLVARLSLLITGYLANNDPAHTALLLKYFTPANINDGLEYLRQGYEFRVALFIWTAVYFSICIFSNVRVRSFERLSAISEKRPYAGLAFLFTDFYAGLSASQLPFLYVLGFLKERAFGFSNLSLSGWLTLQLKAQAIELIVSVIIILIIKFTLERFEKKWHFILPLTAFVSGLLFLLLLQWVALPLFYDISALKDEKLSGELIAAAAANGVTAEKIEVVDESRYSNHSNAFFTGFGPWKRIFICDTLLKNHSRAEVKIVYGHELGHYISNHEFYGVAIASAAIFFISLLIKHIAPVFGIEPSSLFKGASAAMLPLYFILHVCALFLLAPLENIISREFEKAADMFTLEKIARPEKIEPDYISMNKKLAIDNRSNLEAHPINQFWFGTHPPAIERIIMAEKAAAN